MREILFKGKRLDNGEWLQGRSIIRFGFEDGSVEIYMAQNGEKIVTFEDEDENIIAMHSGMFYKIDPETLCQWSGVKDKNGVEVFDGDIVECWSEGVKAKGTVTQRIDGLWIIYPAWQENKMWGLCTNESGVADVEVIGNIHDKKEKKL